MSVRASNLISIPYWDSFNEWVRRFFVHSLIHDVVRSSLSCSIREETSSFHVHLRPHGQLILTSLSHRVCSCCISPFFFNPFYAMFEDLILPSNVSSIVTSVLLQILLVH